MEMYNPPILYDKHAHIITCITAPSLQTSGSHFFVCLFLLENVLVQAYVSLINVMKNALHSFNRLHKRRENKKHKTI